MMDNGSQINLRLTPDWRSSVFALLMLPVLLSLGFWQVERAQEKRQLKMLYQQRQAAGPVTIESLSAGQDMSYQAVILRGRFDNDRQLFLDNRIHQGRFGYEIITPFQLQGSEQWVLVNRGWLAGDVSRRTLPVAVAVEGVVSLFAEVYVPLGMPVTLGEPSVEKNWPRVVQNLQLATLAEEFKQPLFPYSVRLKAGSVGGFKPNWLVVNVQPEKHQAYAFQWFSMAAAVVIIVLLTNTNIVAWLKYKRKKKVL